MLDGPIERADIPALCERLRRLLEESARAPDAPDASEGPDASDAGGDGDRSAPFVVHCDVGGVPRPDAATLDALARLQLTARRAGGMLQLWGVGVHLQRLLTLTGLAEVFEPGPGDSDGGSDGSGGEP